MAKSPEEMMQSMIESLQTKTGRSLSDWLKLARKSGLEKHGEIVKYLKENGLTHGYANLVAHQLLKSDAVSSAAQGVDLVASQYSGKKAPLRPIYDAIVRNVEKFGKDVDIQPKKTYVSLRRSKQFAILQPSTATRLDVGLNLKGVPPQGRLEASGSFNAMVSHRVRLESIIHVDTDLLAWLKEAYDRA
jgi:hypothetical protein